MTLLIWLASVAVYLVGWQYTARYVGRLFLKRGRCHGESRGDGSVWHSREFCKRWDQPGCWRGDDQLQMGPAFAAAGLALLWPLAVGPLWIMHSVRPGPRPLAAEIDRMERELGMDQ